MANISFAITACNEHIELERLLKQLDKNIKKSDEIVVQLDITATQEVKDVVSKYKLINSSFFLIFFGNLKEAALKKRKPNN